MEDVEEQTTRDYVLNKRIADSLEGKKGSVGLAGMSFDNRDDLKKKLLALDWYIDEEKIFMKGPVATTSELVVRSKRIEEKRQFRILINDIGNEVEIINYSVAAVQPIPVVRANPISQPFKV